MIIRHITHSVKKFSCNLQIRDYRLAGVDRCNCTLLFSGELAVGNALDVSDKWLGLLAPGFSLPKLV